MAKKPTRKWLCLKPVQMTIQTVTGESVTIAGKSDCEKEGIVCLLAVFRTKTAARKVMGKDAPLEPVMQEQPDGA